MKTIDDLKLSKKAKAVVKTWLDEWLNMFIAQAQGREGTVHRADFVKDDFFYFTDCTDILSKDPEAKGQENNRSIVNRKQKVMLQLFVKTLLGTVNCKKIKCSHCGYSDRYIGPLSNGTGHFMYCPHCKYTTICTYPLGYKSCIDDVKRKAIKLDFVESNEKAKETCKCKNISNKNCYNCKYFERDEFEEEPCLHCDCSTYSNWKPKECKCKKPGDWSTVICSRKQEKPKLPKEPPLKTVPRFLEKKCKKEKKLLSDDAHWAPPEE
jgi:hypothetical protein